MVHPNTQRLTDYWRTLRGQQDVPARAQVQPADLAGVLTQLFILGRDGQGACRFRLVGGLVADLHGADLRGRPFPDLWAGPQRAAVQAALTRCLGRAEPLVLRGEMLAGERAVGLDAWIAPLRSATGVDRVLGLYQPTGLTARLGGAAVQQLRLSRVVDAEGEEAFTPTLRLAAVDGRRIA